MQLINFAGMLAITCVSLGGCALDDPDITAPDEHITSQMAKNNSAPLSIYLHHPASVDLDLFVTDPFDESTYYGNSPASRGSHLARDTLCSEAGDSAVEVINFPNLAAGRYRISIDFPESCDERVKEVPYLVLVNLNGQQRRIRGRIKYQHFLLIADEFDYQEAP